MKKYLSAAALVALAGPGLGAIGDTGLTGAHRITEVAEGVYAVEPVFAGANGAFIVTPEGVVVVDTHGSPASAETLIDSIGSITDVPVRWVVNTHWHVDHHAGNEAYYDAFGAGVSFIAHDTTRADIPVSGREQFAGMAPYKSGPLGDAQEQLAGGLDAHGQALTADRKQQVEKFSRGQQAFIDQGDAFEFLLPNITLSDSLTLHTSSGPVHILFLGRAHTGGDVIVHVPEKRVVVAGDVLTQPILWTWSGYPSEYVETLRAIETIPYDAMVIGHGGPVLYDKSYLRDVIEALVAMVEFAHTAASNGRSAEEAATLAGEAPSILDHRQVFSDGSEAQDAMFLQMVSWTVGRELQITQ